jgi:hypothetical protein
MNIFDFLNNLYTSGKINLFSQSEINQIEKSLGILTSDINVIMELDETEISDLLDIIDSQISE